jgi:hypothetical protein
MHFCFALRQAMQAMGFLITRRQASSHKDAVADAASVDCSCPSREVGGVVERSLVSGWSCFLHCGR